VTSNFVVVERAPDASRRRAYHRERIDNAPAGSRQQQSYVLSWLQAELARGGSLGELIEFVDRMNAKAAR
jgi:hypothetical protein